MSKDQLIFSVIIVVIPLGYVYILNKDNITIIKYNCL